jgi:hypothetical protein
VNNAVRFDGDNDYARVFSPSGLQLTDSITIEAWISFEEGGLGNPAIVSKGLENPDYEVFLDTNLQSTTIGMSLDPVGTIMSQTVLDAGTWYHIAFTYDGSNIKLYINGALDKTQTGSGLINTSTTSLYMAKQGNPIDHRYKGALDELRIWNIARLQNEIIQDLNKELTGSEKGLVGYWKFNEEDGTKAYDATIHSNNAFLYYGTSFESSGSQIINWLDVNPALIIVLPGISANLDVSFDAEALDGDTYEGQLVLNSNDPVSPQIIVPVQIQVTPVALISLSTSFITFGNVYTGQSKSMEFAVFNLGNDTLDVISMTCPNADYVITPATLTVPPDETDTVTVVYSPVDPENDNAILTIVSNDLNTPTAAINLNGTGISPPVINLTPQSMDTSLYSGKDAYQTMTVSNTGFSSLDFEIGNLALELNNQDYVRVDNPPLYNLDQFTLETWIHISYNYQYGGLITLGNANSERFSLHYDYGSIIYSQDWPDQNHYFYMPGPILHEWHHLAVTHDGATIKYYIDGLLTTSINAPGPQNYSDSYALYFGNQIGGDPEFFDGGLDDVRIWNVARSEEEIRENMMLDLSGSEAGLVGNWKMDEMLEEVVPDASDNENHGTIYGDPDYINFDLMPCWLSVSPSTGICSAGSSLDIEVHYDATLISGGDYSYDLKFLSNDPTNPSASIPISLNITDAPSISAYQDTLDFGILYIGYDVSDTLQVEVTNTGSLDLLITSVSASPEEFDAYPGFAAIDPGDSDIFNVIFTPDDIGDYTGVLTLTNNDPLDETFEVVLTGQFLVPPLISVSPMSLDTILYSGKTANQFFTISNTGGSNLVWEISLENVGYPTITFTKEDYADWTDPANQDCITEDVCITRADQQGIFNAHTENYFSWGSPEDTEWAYGYTADLEPDDYQYWVNAVYGSPPDMVNNPISLHLISDDIYFDVLFQSWTSGGNGGGFSYTRTSILPPWIQVSQESGVLAAGTSTEIEVIFDASFMEGGLYEGAIVIENNDPSNPSESLLVQLEVMDAPSFYANQDTLDFGIVYSGYEKDLELIVTNNGSEDLLITDLAAQPSEYSALPPYAGIDPGETEIFVTKFAPEEIGNYDGTLTFTNNDPLLNPFVITLLGQCFDSPVISVLPDSLYVEIMPGQTVSESLTLNNTGGSDLSFFITPGEGSQNYALEFDGMDDYIFIQNSDLLNLYGQYNVTVEAWIYPYGEAGDWHGIVSKGNDQQYAMTYNKNDRFIHFETLQMAGGWCGEVDSDYYTIPQDAWTHVAAVYDGYMKNIYINGLEAASDYCDYPFGDNNEELRIGQANNGEFFKGILDEVRVWNVARNEQEIFNNMSQEITGFETGLLGYWQFNEGEGSETFDKTLNGNIGLFQNGGYWIDNVPPVSASWLTVTPDKDTIPAGSYMDIEALFDASELVDGHYYTMIAICPYDGWQSR